MDLLLFRRECGRLRLFAPGHRPPHLDSRVSRIQGTYYLATGLWPLIHRRSFEAVSGRKHDFWLAQTVGVITAAVGLSLVSRGSGGVGSPQTTALALGTAAGFAVIDLTYGVRRQISAIYLVDALAQAAMIATHARRSPARSETNTSRPV
jgi:hypothetical protein